MQKLQICDVRGTYTPLGGSSHTEGAQQVIHLVSPVPGVGGRVLSGVSFAFVFSLQTC